MNGFLLMYRLLIPIYVDSILTNGDVLYAIDIDISVGNGIDGEG